MTYDHQAVAGGREVDPELVRMRRLLDEEILPRLERPGRFVEPFRARGIELGSAVACRPLLLWPSTLDGVDPPSRVLRLRDALERAAGVSLDFASATPADLRVHLQSHRLRPFSLPDWLPLEQHPVWLIWLDRPTQIAQAAATLLDAGLQAPACMRGEASPLVIAAGPGASVATRLIAPFVDALLVDPSPANAGAALAELLREADDAARRARSRRWIEGGRAVGPHTPPALDPVALANLLSARSGGAASTLAADGAQRSVGVGMSSSAAPTGRRTSDDPLTVVLPGHLALPWSQRLDEQTWVLRIGAASARLRAELGLPDGATIAETFHRTLADSPGRVLVEVAIGFPGETVEDRAAIFALADQLDLLAPVGARRVTVRVHPFIDAEHSHPSNAWHAHVEAVAARGAHETPALVRTVSVHDDAWLEGQLAAQPERAAAALLALLVADTAQAPAGPRVAAAGSPGWLAVLANWLRAERAEPQSVAPPSPATPGEAARGSIAALTGLEDACARARALAAQAASAKTSTASAQRPRVDQPWERWSNVVPRHFDYRLEYEKRGRLRHVGHREVAEAILRACQRARLPVATTGVAKPRPRLTFGPPLPVGIEGLQEFVDLGLALKVPHLRPTLNEWLPDGLLVNRASFIPSGSCRNALAQPAASQYEAALPRDCWCDPGEGLTLLARRIDALRTAARWPIEGRDGLDAKAQVTDLTVRGGDAGVATLAFTLDLSSPTAKVSPGELLQMLLGGLVHEVRLLRVRRTRLLVRWPQDVGAWLTPSEQVLLVQHELREKAKHCA